MNQTAGATDTRSQLIQAARRLFAERGYDGTSIRDITGLAGANLGAITYHFGSKDALYEEVVASMAEPLRAGLAGAAAQSGAPLERIERVVRAFFEHLGSHPELPRLIVQQFASTRPMPRAGLRVMHANHRTLASLIAEGQADGSIRRGDPRLMALSVGAQPVFLTLIRRVLQEAVAIDQADPGTRARLVESVVAFVRAGLAADRQDSV